MHSLPPLVELFFRYVGKSFEEHEKSEIGLLV